MENAMMEMMAALNSLAEEDIMTYPEGYQKVKDAFAKMGPAGEAMFGGFLMLVSMF